MRSTPSTAPAAPRPARALLSRAGVALALLLSTMVGCQRDKTSKPFEADKTPGLNTPGDTTTASGDANIDSKDILARKDTAPSVDVKHVLLGWKELEAQYGGRMDPRAKARTNADAAKLAKEIAAQLKKSPDQIDALIQKHSEDPGSLEGEPYTITAESRFVPEFKALGLRLKMNEVGIVRTSYGYHVIERVPPPPPDPLESLDILARTPQPGTVSVQHVLVSWKDAPASKQRAPDPRAAARTKADADKLAQEILAKVRAGGDMAALMKEFSEDPGSKDNGMTYEANPAATLVEPFKNLALRLQVGEAGMVKTVFGWHVIKRVEAPIAAPAPPPPPPPPPAGPDALDSADILKRKPVTDKGKVKHVLLGWDAANAGDPRGRKRTRADLEALVKATMDRLKKGEKIEPLMKELSEDQGSAQSGNSYDVTPDASLVQPFKDLSLRLKVGEVGAVKTQFGIHIIQRVE